MDCSRAITAGKGSGGGSALANTWAGSSVGLISLGTFAFAFGFGLALALAGEALRETTARAGKAGAAWGDLKVTISGPASGVCALASGGKRAGGKALAGGGAIFAAAARSASRSGTSARLSSQGKVKPGKPNSWPPKLRLRTNAWSSRESSSDKLKRQRGWPPGATGCHPRPAGLARTLAAVVGSILMRRLCLQYRAAGNASLLRARAESASSSPARSAAVSRPPHRSAGRAGRPAPGERRGCALRGR